MHKQFEFDIIPKYFERFGLGYYGCCEPLDGRIEMVIKIPNVRKISCSPWVKNHEHFAEVCDGKFVISYKPQPANLVLDNWDTDKIRKELQHLLDVAEKYHTPCEFLLKNLSTVSKKPERITEWSRIAHELFGKEWVA
jgi:hypothetical protein